MPRKKMTNTAKATTAGGLVSAVAAYASVKASQATGIPVEVTSCFVGLGIAWLSNWAAKLDPSK